MSVWILSPHMFPFSFRYLSHPSQTHFKIFPDVGESDGEPDLIINHLDQNHCSSLDPSADSDPLDPADPQENHSDSPHDQHRDNEAENGQLGEEVEEAGAEVILVGEHPPRYLSPTALKKHIHNETTKVNNELRGLITKEIRKPGRRMPFKDC